MPSKPTNRPSRRLLVFGPGSLIAVLAAFSLIWSNRNAPTPPAPTRPVIDNRVAPTVLPASDSPHVATLLSAKLAHPLSAQQRSQLAALARQEDRADRQIAASAAHREESVRAYMNELQRSGEPASISEVQSDAARLSAAVAERHVLRDTDWQKALALLNPSQSREAAGRGRVASTAGMTGKQTQ